MIITRPFDTIEKVDQAFRAHNLAEESRLHPRLTVGAFQAKCISGLPGITSEEKGAISRWAASRLRG
jgi:hypothetical protein